MAIPKSLSMKSVGFFGYDDTTNKWQALQIDSLGNLNVLLSPNSKVKVIDSAGTVQDWNKPQGQEASATSMGVVLSTEQEVILSARASETTLSDIKTNTTTATSIGSGKKTVTTAGTQVAIGTSTTIKSVTVKALVSNTGLIYVGTSTVALTDGFELSPGDSVSMDVDNLLDVYIDSAVNGDGVSYLYTV